MKMHKWSVQTKYLALEPGYSVGPFGARFASGRVAEATALFSSAQSSGGKLTEGSGEFSLAQLLGGSWADA